jgi:hypothetical protein
VKYKIGYPRWRRADLYQVVAFATAHDAKAAAIVSFWNENDVRPPPTAFGDVNVTTLAWPMQRNGITITAADAAQALSKSAIEWLTATCPVR